MQGNSVFFQKCQMFCARSGYYVHALKMRRDQLEFHGGAITSKEHMPFKKQYQGPHSTDTSHADLHGGIATAEHRPGGAVRSLRGGLNVGWRLLVTDQSCRSPASEPCCDLAYARRRLQQIRPRSSSSNLQIVY